MSLNAPFEKGAADGFPLNRFTRREARETARLFPSGEGARSVPSRAARPTDSVLSLDYTLATNERRKTKRPVFNRPLFCKNEKWIAFTIYPKKDAKKLRFWRNFLKFFQSSVGETLAVHGHGGKIAHCGALGDTRWYIWYILLWQNFKGCNSLTWYYFREGSISCYTTTSSTCKKSLWSGCCIAVGRLPRKGSIYLLKSAGCQK